MIEFDLYQPEVAERLQKLQPWMLAMYYANVYMLAALGVSLSIMPGFISNPLMMASVFSKMIIFWTTQCWCIELYARFCNKIYKESIQCNR